MTNAIRFFALLLVFSLLPHAGIAHAQIQCACTEGAFQERWKKADAVFLGTVQDIATMQDYLKYREADLPIEVTLSVDEAYKGARGTKTFVIDTSKPEHTCGGFAFEKGKQYLVFAYQRKLYEPAPQSIYRYPDGTFDVAGMCGGTKEAAKAGDDIAAMQALMKYNSEHMGLGRFFSKK